MKKVLLQAAIMSATSSSDQSSPNSNPHSVRVYYPPGDAWKAVHELAYTNKCTSNGYPKCGKGVRDNQCYQFPDETSAKTFLTKVKELPEITAEMARGNLLEAKI